MTITFVQCPSRFLVNEGCTKRIYAIKSFNILAINLNVLHNDILMIQTKLFSDLHLAKFPEQISVKFTVSSVKYYGTK